jgi:hypothetical protein
MKRKNTTQKEQVEGGSETWRVSENETLFYTESETLAGELRKSYEEQTYKRRGVVFAWQFTIPTDQVEMYLRLGEKNSKTEALKTKDLRARKGA